MPGGAVRRLSAQLVEQTTLSSSNGKAWVENDGDYDPRQSVMLSSSLQRFAFTSEGKCVPEGYDCRNDATVAKESNPGGPFKT
jgi:hypothetical protein